MAEARVRAPIPSSSRTGSARLVALSKVVMPATIGPGRRRPSIIHDFRLSIFWGHLIAFVIMHEVTLSFDNGPHPEVTPFVLEILAQRGILSTFFAVGMPCGAAGRHGFAHAGPCRRALDWQSYMDAFRPPRRSDGAGFGRDGTGNHAAIDYAPVSSQPRLFRPFGGGGCLDRRLMNAGGAGVSLPAAASPACCGTRSRATGSIRMAGPAPRWHRWNRSPGH